MLNHTIPTTRNAIAIQLFADLSGEYPRYKARQLENFYRMTIVLSRSLRDVGYKEDIVVVTNHEPFVGPLHEEGLIVEMRDLFDYPALYQFKCGAWGISRFDMNKMHYWSLVQYNRVIGIDNDMLARPRIFDSWASEDVLVCGGGNSPVNSGIILIQPSIETYNDIRKTLATATFSPQTGWNNCGTYETERITIKSWEFQAANAAQGFIPYYFKDKIRMFNWQAHFQHYSGISKYRDPNYVAECRRHGLELWVPHFARRDTTKFPKYEGG